MNYAAPRDVRVTAALPFRFRDRCPVVAHAPQTVSAIEMHHAFADLALIYGY
jgi:hypothetical protein